MKWAIIAFAALGFVQAAPVALFDGKSLDGWQARKGEENWWRVEDGMITGGSLTETVPFNTFLASSKAYGNFDLTYKIRLVAGEGFVNSGMQIRSQRLAENSEMSGYQVDAGAGYWGDLYDESRRGRALAKTPNPSIKEGDWNEFRVLCEGPRIRTWINGVAAIDYTESEHDIPASGFLGLQAHGGGKLLVQLKDISIKEIPSPAGGALTPSEEQAGFTLPAGYSAELVASEEQGVGKPITVTWDKHGRMWTMTALEYPIDANENQAAADELYKHGGRDRVLVFDEPNNPGPQTPRTFAEGLALPTGLLPLADGTLVQYGTEIRHYHDADGDGKAEGFETVLQGFGVQDSHLFPHQFERAPGGWIYLAQGAFNYSKVRRPNAAAFENGEAVVPFNNCKLARMRPDGSGFDPLTGGPNNIWGLVLARNGEVFVQEANDLGYPVAEFAPGTHYPTGFGTKMRDDAPVLPPSTPNEPMGGTGMSGLALAEDADTPFSKGQGDASVFYIANPITSKIQIVTMTRDEAGHPTYKKGADFLTSKDPWFRPISIHFGPDGCLYVTDWYNKIISHNEVPRTHPDRDKTRGRIWRIRHESQQAAERVDLAKLSSQALFNLLGAPNAKVSQQAWGEMVDRKAIDLGGKLLETVANSTVPLPKRLGALWAAEGLHLVKTPLLVQLAKSPEQELQHEAVRMAGEASLPEPDFLQVISALGNEPQFRVRAAIANAVRYHHSPTAKIVACAAALGLEPMSGNSRNDYDRTFERYLARWAMSVHPKETREMLTTLDLPIEAKLLAARSHEGADAAAAMVALLPEIKRSLITDELALLAAHLGEAPVLKAFGDLLKDPEQREPMLRAMLQFDNQLAGVRALAPLIYEGCSKTLNEKRTPERLRLTVQLARKFKMRSLFLDVHFWMKSPDSGEGALAEGLATLREIGEDEAQTYAPYLDHPDAAVRREALMGVSAAGDVDEVAKRWLVLPGIDRSLAITGLTSTKIGAEAFAHALMIGRFKGIDGAAIEKLIGTLGPEHPKIIAILNANKGLLQPILRFGEGGPGRVVTNINLKGPFTVEAWVRLPAPIDNNDGLLGQQGSPDINFAGARLRVYGGDAVGDLIIADRAIQPDRWTHCAITRDATHHFKIHLDGEPDAAQSREFAGDFTGFNIGESHRGRDTTGSYDEVRVWNVARSDEEIRRDAHTRYSDAPPPALVTRISGDHQVGTMEGTARVSQTMDFPKLVSPSEAAELDKKFSRFREMAAVPGDAEKGRQLVQTTCMICHQIRGEGTAIGPNLSGAGAMGTEALLRNILTPNAQLESGYYRHDIKLNDGTQLSGFLTAETEKALIIRPVGGSEIAFLREEVISHEISKLSIMPEGLLDGFTPAQVADLFTYLKSLR